MPKVNGALLPNKTNLRSREVRAVVVEKKCYISNARDAHGPSITVTAKPAGVLHRSIQRHHLRYPCSTTCVPPNYDEQDAPGGPHSYRGYGADFPAHRKRAVGMIHLLPAQRKRGEEGHGGDNRDVKEAVEAGGKKAPTVTSKLQPGSEFLENLRHTLTDNPSGIRAMNFCRTLTDITSGIGREGRAVGMPSPTSRWASGGRGAPAGARWRDVRAHILVFIRIYRDFLENFRRALADTVSGIRREGRAGSYTITKDCSR
ncbi:hypothetical protein B0H14DRAFT_3172754 [Mycena olivaceomarginata]|nr:hypothetical protein B0H14DRAFT_3172754 [Mycena olivaceomarginata]